MASDITIHQGKKEVGARSGEFGVKRSVNVTVGALASKILAVEVVTRGKPTSASAERAIRSYLNDKGLRRARLGIPDLSARPKPGSGRSRFTSSSTPSSGGNSPGEAMSQDVSAQQLLEHAVLRFAADEQAGRVTERIIEDLD